MTTNRRRLSWAAKGGCKEKPCKSCLKSFKPATSGHLYCPSCVDEAKRRRHREGQAAWRAKDPERHRKMKANWDLKKYGLTVEDYEAMLADQDGRCAICRERGVPGRSITRVLAVDHCHATGRVRALLCHRCNGALGMVGDRINVLERAIAYLKSHQAPQESAA